MTGAQLFVIVLMIVFRPELAALIRVLAERIRGRK